MATTCDDSGEAHVTTHTPEAAVDQSVSQSADVENALSKHTGAPLGNANAAKHGLRSGKFPPGTEYLAKQIASFRKAAETAILTVRGEIGFFETMLLQTAIEHYSHGLKCRRWLRVGWTHLGADQRLAYSREIGRAFEARDKALKQLGVDTQANDTKTTLYTLPSDLDDASDGEYGGGPEAPQ